MLQGGKMLSGSLPQTRTALAAEMEGHGQYWCSKDRFAAKRLLKCANDLSPRKREIIEKYSSCASLLNISPFNMPNEIIDFIAKHTVCELREFCYRGRRIVFTKEIVKSVFGLRSGTRPVELLTKTVHSEIRDSYKDGLSRLPIENAAKMLKELPDSDEDAIIRTWDLLCWATVLNPGTNNMMCLEYVGCMADPKKTHEFDWEEHILELLMHYIQKIQKKKEQSLTLEGVTLEKVKEQLETEAQGPSKKKKKNLFEFWMSGPLPLLAVVYMDHLDIPRNGHFINNGIPRVCFVTSDDFNSVVKIDRENKIMLNKTIFGRRPLVRVAFNIFEKHNGDGERLGRPGGVGELAAPGPPDAGAATEAFGLVRRDAEEYLVYGAAVSGPGAGSSRLLI